MKNKKLLAVFAIPLVIAVMVLPLCSFTTTLNETGARFESSSRVDLNYLYSRNNNSYFGTIPNFLSCSLITSSVTSDVKNSIKFTACNYVMDSDTQLEYKSFASSRNPSILDRWELVSGNYNLSARFSIESDSPSESTLYGVSFRDYGGEPYTIELFDSNYLPILDSYHGVGVKTFGTVYYRESISDDWSTFRYDVTLPYSYFPNGIINTLAVYDAIIANSGLDERMEFRFAYLTLQFCIYNTSVSSDYMTGSELLDVVGGVRIGGPLEYYGVYSRPNSADRDYYYYSQGYDIGYDEGYNLGYDIGLSNADGVWGSFTNFLTTTVGGFLDFHLTPNITISGILSVILSITLVVLFLKLFAGG